ncbi:DEAD/DEAH box helicase [Streptomyces niveus]|uniref:DEAD/DEAH box helicase n=1 Tax=Streptomyces niveus TaxID=193462 RepID=UPI003868714B
MYVDSALAASGSGKALIAQRVCAELAPQGATLVLVPTKALVVQTARKWREAGYRGLLTGVCSLSQDDSGLSSWELTMTSDPATVAARVAASSSVPSSRWSSAGRYAFRCSSTAS